MNKTEKLNKLTDSRAYKLLTTIDQDIYFDEFWQAHSRRKRTSVIGSKNYFCWKRKNIYRFKYRMYRTWKYNRKTCWK